MRIKNGFQWLILGALVSAVCFIFAGGLSRAQNLNGFVVPGERFDGITIGKSTADDVISTYGDDYKLINHKEYSFEMIYKKLGISFYYCQRDPRKEIFVVEIESPSRAMTSKGIILGQSTFEDVFRLYGNAEETSSGFEYPGINFNYEEDNVEEDSEDARTQPVAKPAEPVKDKSQPADPVNGRTVDLKVSELPEPLQKTITDNILITPAARGDIGNAIADSEDDDAEEDAAAVADQEEEDGVDEGVRKKTVKLIELIEKNGLRQCDSQFPKR
ncbi:MAG: hypothetical protein R2747_23725 [Pyrinomonadaceae bacterium]